MPARRSAHWPAWATQGSVLSIQRLRVWQATTPGRRPVTNATLSGSRQPSGEATSTSRARRFGKQRAGQSKLQHKRLGCIYGDRADVRGSQLRVALAGPAMRWAKLLDEHKRFLASQAAQPATANVSGTLGWVNLLDEFKPLLRAKQRGQQPPARQQTLARPIFLMSTSPSLGPNSTASHDQRVKDVGLGQHS